MKKPKVIIKSTRREVKIEGIESVKEINFGKSYRAHLYCILRQRQDKYKSWWQVSQKMLHRIMRKKGHDCTLADVRSAISWLKGEDLISVDKTRSPHRYRVLR